MLDDTADRREVRVGAPPVPLIEVREAACADDHQQRDGALIEWAGCSNSVAHADVSRLICPQLHVAATHLLSRGKNFGDPVMERRRFGNSPVEVSAISLGCWIFGVDWWGHYT